MLVGDSLPNSLTDSVTFSKLDDSLTHSLLFSKLD